MWAVSRRPRNSARVQPSFACEEAAVAAPGPVDTQHMFVIAPRHAPSAQQAQPKSTVVWTRPIRVDDPGIAAAVAARSPERFLAKPTLA